MTTFFYGKNLCNLLSNLVIENFNIVDPNHNTSIRVTDIGQFFILTGKTTIKNPLNYSNKFRDYFEEKTKKEKSFNVIDLIRYNTIETNVFVFLEKTYTYQDLITFIDFSETGVDGFLNINDNTKQIFSNNITLFEFYTQKLNLDNYNFIKSLPIYPYISDDFFGKNLKSDKLYEVFLKYVSYNIFDSNLCNDASLTFFSNENIDKIDFENSIFNIDSNSLITSKKWLESLIKDIFNPNSSEIIETLNLKNYNFEDDILLEDKCWMVLDKRKEILLL